MPTIHDVLDSVDGLRDDASRRVERHFGSLAALAGASEEDLEAIQGIGQVMAGRILGAAMQAQQRVSQPARLAKDANARTAATADRVIDAASAIADGTVGRTAPGTRDVIEDAEVTARTGVYRIHAKGDETVDRTVEAVEGSKVVARSAADQARATARGLAGQALEVTTAVARSTLTPARSLLGGLFGRDDATDE